jgi:hypothetical protein
MNRHLKLSDHTPYGYTTISIFFLVSLLASAWLITLDIDLYVMFQSLCFLLDSPVDYDDLAEDEEPTEDAENEDVTMEDANAILNADDLETSSALVGMGSASDAPPGTEQSED